MKSRGILLIVGLAIIIGVSIFVVQGKGNNDGRPKHCIGNICAESIVFSELPKYPNNLQEVSLATETNAYDLPENFSNKYPDESYYKQPEFYPDDSFQNQGLKYYTTTPMKWSAGSAAYPGDYVISNMGNKDLIHIGDTIRVITYWHAGYGIYKYQLFKLTPEYPSNMSIRMGTYSVVQDPSEAASCLDVRVEPSNIMLGPSAPIFDYNWSQKVTAYITVKCTGKFGIEMMPTDADPQFIQDAIREYGIYNIVTNPIGSPFQVFFDIQ
jgi:hypothetical protein